MFLAMLIGFYTLGSLVCSVVLVAIVIANARVNRAAHSPARSPKSDRDLQKVSLQQRISENPEPMMVDTAALVDAA